jgi:hypothetical protein
MSNLITLTRINERSAHQITWLVLQGAVFVRRPVESLRALGWG